MKPFSFERAQDEAKKMQDAIESGEAINYAEAEKIVEKESGRAPEGWITAGGLKKNLNKSHYTIVKQTEQYRKSNPEWFKYYLTESNDKREYYSPELIKKLNTIFSKQEPAPEGWLTSSFLRRIFKERGLTAIISQADKYRESHPDWFKQYLSKRGQSDEHYSPELIEQLRLDFSKYEKAPEGWFSAGALSKLLNKSHTTIKIQAEQYRKSNPEWFKDYLDQANRPTEHYSPELIEQLRSYFSKYEKAPKGWLDTDDLQTLFNKSESTIRIQANKYQEKHPDWFMNCIGEKGQIVSCFSPELIEQLRLEFPQHELAHEGWFTFSRVAKIINRNQKTVSMRADKYRQSHPEWFKQYMTEMGKLREHYSPELIEQLRLDFSKYESAPKGWLTASRLAKLLDKDYENVINQADKYRESHPEWFKKYLDTVNKESEHYSPELIEQLRLDFSKYEKAPEGWFSAGALTKLFNRAHNVIVNRANKHRELHSEWFKYYLDKSGGSSEHYSPELIEQLRLDFSKYEKAPEGWFPVGTLSKLLSRGDMTIKKLTDKYRESRPEWFKWYLSVSGQVAEYYSPELITILKKELELPEPPTNWQSREEIAKKTGVSIEEAEKIISKLKKQFPEQHGKFKKNNEE